MFRKYPTFPVLFFLASLLLVVPIFSTQAAAKDLIPAGTIITCILDEPNFSAKTAQVGDPVLCSLGPLRSFGHMVFPRGAQLSGHLQDYKDPGHFWGKGSLSLEFDRVILPNAEVLPLNAKIISAPHQRVDKTGSIKGKGHPKRDAALWLVPIFWPIKVLTLPARGPYPTLKGESRLSMRLMEDVELPTVAKAYPAPPWANQNSSYRLPSQIQPASSRTPRLIPRTEYAQSGTPAVVQPAPVPTQTLVSAPAERITSAPAQPMTIIALQAGSAVLARDYWVEGENIHCVAENGTEQQVPLNAVDLAETVKVNQERNVGFALRSRAVVEQ
jgi:hypothetical protein